MTNFEFWQPVLVEILHKDRLQHYVIIYKGPLACLYRWKHL